MTRTLPSGYEAETIAARYRAAYLVTLAFDSGTLYFWTGIGNLSYGGNTFTGTGNLGDVSIVTETADMRPTGATLKLSGVASSLISIMLGEHYQGRAATIRYAVFDANWAMVEALTVFAGRMDVMRLIDAGELVEVTLTVEHRMIAFDRPQEVYFYTHVDQQRLYSGDLGLEFVAPLADKTIYWGRVQPGAVPSGGSGGGTSGGDPSGGAPGGQVGDPGVPGGSGYVDAPGDDDGVVNSVGGQVGDHGVPGGSGYFDSQDD